MGTARGGQRRVQAAALPVALTKASLGVNVLAMQYGTAVAGIHLGFLVIAFLAVLIVGGPMGVVAMVAVVVAVREQRSQQ